MSISIIGAVAASGTSLTPTAGIQGDWSIAFAFNSGAATAPTVPANWLLVASGVGNTCGGTLCYHVCSGSSDIASGFTSATELMVIKARGVLGIGGVASSNATGTSISYPALTMTQGAPAANVQQSVVLGVAGHRTATNVATVLPTGMAAISGANTGAGSIIGGFQTSTAVSGWGAQATTVNASSGHESFTVELLGAFSTWNAYDSAGTANLTLADANLAVTAVTSPTNTGMYVRSSQPVFGGKVIFAFYPTNLEGDTNVDCQVGIANSSFTPLVNGAAGATTASMRYNDNSAGSGFSVHINNVGTIFSPKVTRTQNQVEYYAFDFGNLLAWAWVGSGWVQNGNPDLGASGLSIAGYTGPWFALFGNGIAGDAGVFDGTAAGNPTKTFVPWDNAATQQNIVNNGHNPGFDVNITLSNSNETGLSATTPGDHNGVRGFNGHSTGRYLIGYTYTALVSGGGTGFGVCNVNSTLAVQPGNGDSNGICFNGGIGKPGAFINDTFTNVSPVWGSGFTATETGWLAFDLGKGLAWAFSSSFSGLGWNGSGVGQSWPDSNTGGFPYTDIVGQVLYPFFSAGQSGTTASINLASTSGAPAGASSFQAWGGNAFEFPTPELFNQAVKRAGFY